MQQPIAYGPMKATTERQRLIEYVEEQEKRVALRTPHCHLALKHQLPSFCSQPV
jgi:hypothetical protein